MIDKALSWWTRILEEACASGASPARPLLRIALIALFCFISGVNIFLLVMLSKQGKAFFYQGF